ncbi:MAG: VCBS repeat-containing protein [Bryobacterales bacterium]|nr:VCBS repeat-containing protein [Bryobacterales bacterium]
MWKLSLALLIAAFPAPARDALAAGKDAFRRGHWALAETEFQAALQRSPKDSEAHKWLGMTFAAQEKLERAEPSFRQACRLAPRDAGACYYWARSLFGLARLADAESAFRQVLRTEPNSGRALGGLALVLAALDRPGEAGQFFQQAIAAGDPNARADYERFRRQPALRNDAVPIQFQSAPLPFTVRNNARGERSLPETMIAGAAAFDYNNDGWADLFFTTLAGPCGLLRNRGDGTFDDVSALAGFASLANAGWMGVAPGDYDNDGDLDLFLTGLYRQALLRNDNGIFIDATAASGLDLARSWTVSALWFDYNADRLPDLFVVRYVSWDPAREPRCEFQGIRQYCHPRHFQPLSNALYRNLGGGRFRDVSRETGLADHLGKGMGAAAGDADGDGRLDLFVANDTVPNFLFLARGTPTQPRFEESALPLGVALNEAGTPVSSMGVEFRDLDNDGWDDIAVTALSNETFPLFRNRGGNGFEDITLSSGMARASLAWTGWSLAAADFDNDGCKDIVTANGHVMDNAEAVSGRQSRQPLLVLRNLLCASSTQKTAGGLRFASKQIEAPAFYRGLVYADFDNDGRLDIAVTRLNEPALILWNRTAPAGAWIRVALPETALGARVEVDAGERRQSARLLRSNGYGSASAEPLHFGLGTAAAVDRIQVTWSDGLTRQIGKSSVNRTVTVPAP